MSKKCLHCGTNKPDYCEECFQTLTSINAKLQKRKISQKNRVQIPTMLMNELGIVEGDTVIFNIKDNKLIIEKEVSNDFQKQLLENIGSMSVEDIGRAINDNAKKNGGMLNGM